MKKLLLVGDHPYGHSGNSHMINACLQQIDLTKYDITVFAAFPVSCPVSSEVRIIEGGNNPYDDFGASQLVSFLNQNKFDVVCFIGLDIWTYSKVYPQLLELKTREKLFHEHVNEDTLLFGFFGHNQFRKDPLRVIKAFFEVKKEIPNSALYLHTELASQRGIFNIEQYIRDCGGKLGDVLVKKQGHYYSTETLIEVYNAVDCVVNVSLQEGLSWTVLESMLCGTPVIASNNTAHIELIEEGAGIGVASTELAYIPLLAANGASTFIESKACSFPDLVRAMKSVQDVTLRKDLKYRGIRRATEWLQRVSDITNLLAKSCNYVSPVRKEKARKEAILFAQHSSAGDVIMTTRCFKDLKKRNPDIPFYYMTQKKYQDIIVGNPYIDEIFDWDEAKLQEYKFVYNPHGERILPGHWGRNSNSILADFYWKVLMIDEPDDFFIDLKVPENPIADEILDTKLPICILHTTGGDAEFRTYEYMGDVAEGLGERYFTIQVGGKDDFPAKADLDLRGKLSFRESAWVVSKAAIAVTVDSFISHLCGALGVSQVCLFGSGNASVVKPLQVKGKLIEMSPDYIKNCMGLGPCSAGVRECPIKCTGSHNPNTILENIKKLEETI